MAGLLLYLPSSAIKGQTLSGRVAAGDEAALYAQTKQVTQFFRRFNGEEDLRGRRTHPGDSLYHDRKLREKYLNMIFDNESPFIQNDAKKAFIQQVMDVRDPAFLDFHGPDWFAELSASVRYNRKKTNMLIFLQLEQENLGYKWAITNIYFDQFLKFFNQGSHDKIRSAFLHPMSHELDFMNMRKVFDDPVYSEYYASSGFKPDYRTLLFYEIKKGNLEFIDNGSLKFHIFQVDGWYFELSWVNRPGFNTGWLITKLYRISPEEKEELIQFYLP